MTPFRPGALSSTKRPAGSLWLRWVLVFIDTEAIFLAWAVALVFFQRVPVSGRSSTTGVVVTVALTGAALLLMASQELYLARVSSIRAVELTRIFRVSVLTGLAAGLGAEILDGQVAAKEAALGALLMLVFLIIGRSAYRAWLTARRAASTVGTQQKSAPVWNHARCTVTKSVTTVMMRGGALRSRQTAASGLW